jgi:hypothetical protein
VIDPPNLDASLVVGVAMAVPPEGSSCFCFFSAVYELMLQMIARCFTFGHETPERR